MGKLGFGHRFNHQSRDDKDSLAGGPSRSKAEFLKKLQDGKPITPKHKPPRRPEGEDGVTSFITEADRQFFADFTNFADLLNRWLAGDEDWGNPWRVQELPNPELRSLGSSDGPSYGRRYDIFYNQIKIGDLEIEAHWNYSPAAPEVTTAIELDWARLLRFGQISNLIYWIGILTASGGGPSGEERRAAMDALRGAALDQLWQIEYDRDIDDRAMGGNISIQFSGTADLERLANFGR